MLIYPHLSNIYFQPISSSLHNNNPQSRSVSFHYYFEYYLQVGPGLSGGGVGPGMLSPQQALFMQQQSMGSSRGPFGQQAPGGVLQGPLAYLEKTTSNIGIY